MATPLTSPWRNGGFLPPAPKPEPPRLTRRAQFTNQVKQWAHAVLTGGWRNLQDHTLLNTMELRNRNVAVHARASSRATRTR